MSSPSVKIPVWFWIVAALALLWNLMGVMAFFAETGKTPEDLAAMAEAERHLYETYPMWAMIAFGAAVFGGAIGSLLLLLRSKFAQAVLVISLVGVIVQMVHSFFIAKSMAVYGPGAMIMPTMVIVIAAALVWLARSASAKGWLR